MADELRLAGEGVLRRAGNGYSGDIALLGVQLELIGIVAEDEQGKHFRLSAFFRCHVPDDAGA